eukprot:SAG31_NODE_5796_length_2324_cov_1.516854_3_plen_115_part_00
MLSKSNLIKMPLQRADNTGCGAPGDATHLLHAMLGAGFGPGEAAFGWMFDPECLAEAMSAGVGATIAVSLGGKLDPDHAGLPIVAQAAKVVAITDGKHKASTGSVGAGSMVRSC